MDKQISGIAKSVIILLNNIDELVTVSNQRREARDVMKALTIYAKDQNFKLPEEKIGHFNAILLDSRPITIHYLLQSIAGDVAKTDIIR